MTRSEMEEAISILNAILDALLATLEGNVGRSFMDARNAIGVLRAGAEDMINDGDWGDPLVECFQLCREAGATRTGMDGIRVAMASKSPRFIPGTIIASSGYFLSLNEQARILIETMFVSRDDIDVMIDTMNKAFEPAEEFAAVAIADPRVYQALVGLHASVTAHLTERARPLPRMIRYQFPLRMPSLKLAMRIYGDARRADELKRENRTVHPMFMQAAGRCMSA